MMQQDHAWERPGTERSGHVGVDAIPVVARHDNGFGQQPFIHVGLVHDISPLPLATARFSRCAFVVEGTDPAPL
jgi:hypothetical protein